MDLLDRLLAHDAWTTRQLLLRSRDLTDAQLDRPFDIGHETLRRTFVHIIGNMEVWTDLLQTPGALRPRSGGCSFHRRPSRPPRRHRAGVRHPRPPRAG